MQREFRGLQALRDRQEDRCASREAYVASISLRRAFKYVRLATARFPTTI
jgi:hypothetical protein